MTAPRHPQLAFTDEVVKVRLTKREYGLLVSREMYAALELRSCLLRDEVPLANRMPVAVDPSLEGGNFRKVNNEEWKRVTQR